MAGSDSNTARKKDYSGSPSSLKIPPHSIEAEESVLGAILLDNEAINSALEKITEQDFYRSAHRHIFAAMTALTARQDPIDVVSVSQELKKSGTLDDVGGIENLSRLVGLVPSAGNIAYYAKTVKEMSLRRNVIHEASEIVTAAFDTDGDVADFLDIVEQRILQVSQNRTNSGFSRVADVVQDSIKLVEELYDRKEPITGIGSGFVDLDRMTAGFQKSDLVIIAARPSMGKTALVLCMAAHCGISLKKPAAVFSLEMSKEQLVMRMLCSEAKVSASKVRTGHLGERDFPKLVDAASKLAESRIYIDDTPALTITELRAKARRLAHQDKELGLIVVDYLQLMRSPAYMHSREQEISDISRSLKALAKELGVPVIALSQLNRSVESRNDKRPMMSDLRESGAIEQDADLIMFIYRDEVYNPETQDKGVAELIISKQRSGPTGTVRIAFMGEFTKFDNLAERDDFAPISTPDITKPSTKPALPDSEDLPDPSSFDPDLF